MFLTKLLCMAALSFALVSSPEAYSAEKCGITNLVINSSGNFTGNVDPLKCKVSKFNNATNSYLGNENPTFHKFSIAMNIISPMLGTIICDALRQKVLERYRNNRYVKYIKYRSENKIRDVIMGIALERLLSGTWATMLTGLCAMAAIAEGWTGTSISLIPPIIFAVLRFGTDGYYTMRCRYSTDQQLYNNLEEDIAYLRELYDNNHPVRDFVFGITEDDKRLERKRMFESLINRGQIGTLLQRNLNFQQMLEAGVSPGFLYAIMPQLQPAQLNLLQAALQAAGLQLQPVVHVNAIQLNAVPQHVQAEHAVGIQL